MEIFFTLYGLTASIFTSGCAQLSDLGLRSTIRVSKFKAANSVRIQRFNLCLVIVMPLWTSERKHRADTTVLGNARRRLTTDFSWHNIRVARQ